MFQLDFQVNGNVDQQMVFFHKTCEIQEVGHDVEVTISMPVTPGVLSVLKGCKHWPGAENSVKARRELCFCSCLLWVCLWVVLTEHISSLLKCSCSRTLGYAL